MFKSTKSEQLLLSASGTPFKEHFFYTRFPVSGGDQHRTPNACRALQILGGFGAALLISSTALADYYEFSYQLGPPYAGAACKAPIYFPSGSSTAEKNAILSQRAASCYPSTFTSSTNYVYTLSNTIGTTYYMHLEGHYRRPGTGVTFRNSVWFTKTADVPPADNPACADPTACKQRDRNAGPPTACGGTNPINLATGNKYQVETDLKGGPRGLRFRRFYNSDGPGSTALGRNWRHSYQSRVVFETTASGQTAVVRQPDGRALHFTSTDGSTWTADADVTAHFEADGSDWTLTEDDGSVHRFDANGHLVEWSALQGPHLTLAYGGGRLTSVTDEAGRALTFGYDSDDRLTAVTPDTGTGYLYSYDDASRLSQVTTPDQHTRQYHYEDTRFPFALTGITNERGVRSATWTYDTAGRAVSSAHADGANHTSVTFNSDGSTTVTNALGKDTTYTFALFNDVHKPVQVTGHPTALCAGANRNYSYTAEGRVASSTDWNGNTTTYQYNARGLEISRTEADGAPEARTITTQWHPTLALPVKITEPTQITEMTYDADGRLLSREITSNP